MPPAQKKERRRQRKVAEYSNKHCRDSKMDRMSMYTTESWGEGGSYLWKTRAKRKLTLHYKQKDSKKKT